MSYEQPTLMTVASLRDTTINLAGEKFSIRKKKKKKNKDRKRLFETRRTFSRRWLNAAEKEGKEEKYYHRVIHGEPSGVSIM